MATLQITSSREERFDALYREFYPRIYGYLLHRSHEHELSEDLAQEVFVRFYQKFDFSVEQRTVLNWLYRVAGNIFIDHRRRARLRDFLPLEGTDEDGALLYDVALESDLLEEVIEQEARALLLARHMPRSRKGKRPLRVVTQEHQMIALVLSGYKLHELPNLLKVDPATIKTQWRRLLITLREEAAV